MSNLHLVYINPVGKDSNDLFVYEFFFSKTPDIVWGEDWNVACPSACGNLLPDPDTYSEVKILKTPIPFFCVQENSCFSIQDSIDGLICLAGEDISNCEEYPQPYRIVFQFGEEYDKVEEKLAGRHQFFTDILEQNIEDDDTF